MHRLRHHFHLASAFAISPSLPPVPCLCSLGNKYRRPDVYHVDDAAAKDAAEEEQRQAAAEQRKSQRKRKVGRGPAWLASCAREALAS